MSHNDPAVSSLQRRHKRGCACTADWGRIQLDIGGYVCTELPPVDLVSSGRCIVSRAGEVLVVRDVHNPGHIMPGGRLEAGETPEQAVRREVLEETGWELGSLRYLGFMHLRHRTPRPEGYRYPYPDFFWAIYSAEATVHRPEAREEDGYELDARFVSIEKVMEMELETFERLFLSEAI